MGPDGAGSEPSLARGKGGGCVCAADPLGAPPALLFSTSDGIIPAASLGRQITPLGGVFRDVALTLSRRIRSGQPVRFGLPLERPDLGKTQFGGRGRLSEVFRRAKGLRKALCRVLSDGRLEIIIRSLSGVSA